jgi:hypothetical protein
MLFYATSVSKVIKLDDRNKYHTEQIRLKGCDLELFSSPNHETRNIASMNGLISYGEILIYVRPMHRQITSENNGIGLTIQVSNDKTESVGVLELSTQDFDQFCSDIAVSNHMNHSIQIRTIAVGDRVIKHTPLEIFQKHECLKIEFTATLGAKVSKSD